ncbi:MAG: hypothetical protein JKY54_16430 [Flavobacteriales bacterium]|nr:hypothetical protein [Flavobacteriales bacterium]
MVVITNKIKAYFSKKEKGEETGKSPEGTCPICWGHSEWDGQHYELIRDKHLTPGSSTYDSFISKIVDAHVKTTHRHKNRYVCTTCDKVIGE